jgi:hypothetical protein
VKQPATASRRSRQRHRDERPRPESCTYDAGAFAWLPGELVVGLARSRAQADLQSARQVSRVAREWLAHVERGPRPPPGIVDRRLLAAKLALDDLAEQERRAEAVVQAMGAR